VAREEGIGGAAGAPLIHLGEVTGVLYMAKRSPGRFGDRSLALLEEMAAILGPLCAVPELSRRPARSAIQEEESTSAGNPHNVVGQILSDIQASARRLRQRVTAGGSSQALAEDLRSIEEQASRAATHLRQAETRC
jgi:GAF domain-containing protein